ncbi:hypothetical protein [Bradyrhizobium sp. ARR65]|uniref:hypothetical protein n=1 Tax=Bradyrhizobium sp. ARR65 TaxID=1040989 RepID=UPI001FD9051F|nr:hypothetical protein [Bradyrhizobium sp. ARR65]
MRVFLGWLRSEKRHCSMVAIPTIEEEDARRPNRERQNLVTEQTRIINQIKAIFSRFGIRSLRPTMRKLTEGLEDWRTAEGTPLPQNTLLELRRHLAPLRFVRDQIRAVEQERQRKLAVAPKSADAMVCLIARVLGAGVETADMLVNEIFSRHWRDRKAVARYAGLLARRERQPSTRTGSCARWQCPRPQRHDPAGLAFCQAPKEQRPGPMVRGANRRRTRQHTQDDDCGTGAQAAHRPLASRYKGRSSAGRRVTSSVMNDSMEGEQP